MADPDPPTLDYAPPEDSWVAIKTFRKAMEAELTAVFLRQEGITCHVHTVGVYGGNMARAELWVLAHEQEQVKQRLEEMDKRQEERLDPKQICPRCGTPAPRKLPVRRQAIGLTMAAVALPASYWYSYSSILCAAGLLLSA
jgi:hypothetical protein